MRLPLVFSPAIRSKLQTKHGVTEREVEQCFENLCGSFAIDDSPKHRTDPPTMFFVAPTNRGRHLKVVFVREHGNMYIKSAFDANATARAIYEKFCGRNQE